MKPTNQQCGLVAALDGCTWSLLRWLELFTPCSEARIALSREPDFEDEYMVSWGSITRAEVERVVSYETDECIRADLLEEIDELLSTPGAIVLSLYYRDHHRGH